MSDKDDRACVACGDSPVVTNWTDTHRVGTCGRCGMPHKPYENHAPAVSEEGVEVFTRYWRETGQRIPGQAMFHFPQLMDAEMKAFRKWDVARRASEEEVQREEEGEA